MITDKDREISKEIINGMDELYLNNMSCNAPMFIEFTANIISRIRAESADQARKEAAERAVAFLKKEWYWFNDDACYADELRTAILGDSVVKENLITDQISDAGKKLDGITVAIEKVDTSNAVSRYGSDTQTRLIDRSGNGNNLSCVGSVSSVEKDCIKRTATYYATLEEKLAIAEKALEYVASKSLPSSVFESHYSRLQDACAKASDALKEIQ